MAEDLHLNTDAPTTMNDTLHNDSYAEEINMEDQTHIQGEDNMVTQGSRKKRNLETDNGEEWQQVNRSAKKKVKMTEIPRDDSIQICINSYQALPKQFALARLFREHNILGIVKIKYLNQHKINASFDTEYNAEKFLTCKAFRDMEWRCQKTWEVGMSFGIIKNIETELTEEEILKNIECDIEIALVKRLNRRKDDTWVPSDSIKIGFKGPNLPTYVYLLDLRIKVDKFVFPVTQCSKCWRFGHTSKFCPSSRVVCPKCAGSHENCEKTTFQCPNCSENHMALDRKACKVYKKEKKLRELMAEFNCSYRKAMSMFVPPSPTTFENYKEPFTSKHVYAPTNGPEYPVWSHEENIHKYKEQETYASRTRTNAGKKKKKKRVHIGDNVYAEMECSTDSEATENSDAPPQTEDFERESRRKEYKSLIDILLNKIKIIIFDENLNVASKLNSIVKTTIEWITAAVLNFCSKFPIFKSIYEYMFSSG